MDGIQSAILHCKRLGVGAIVSVAKIGEQAIAGEIHGTNTKIFLKEKEAGNRWTSNHQGRPGQQ
ncbi:hypothetical protein CDL15_Pgr019440 [Punica granatum]|uniref:Uncharacterized protein n=1 Tax=Punica granatum TaxID=22663 RepID=A0A218XT75_PUNGR|nr:hypothetical protein CDL15_Pgr019440 [Punica granatum]